jgi:hypothetical protein
MKQSFSVSSIAKQTGIDRRTIDRALRDVRPVETKQNGGRTSPQYDRDEAAAALADAGAPRSQVARMTPFGGSISRLVAWNSLIVYIRLAQRALAMDREDWPERFGVSTAQADRIAARSATIVMAMADHLLANYGDRCEDCTSIDDALAGCELPARDAKPGEFAAALDLSDPVVRAMMEAAIAAEPARR